MLNVKRGITTAVLPSSSEVSHAPFAFLLIIGCLLIRPTALGQSMSFFGTAIIGFVGLYYSLFHRFELVKIRRNLYVAGFVALFWSYLATHSILLGNESNAPIYSLILICVSTFSMAVCLSNSRIHDLFFKYLVVFLVVQCLSFIATMALTVFAPLESLLLSDFEVEGYSQGTQLYLPFTFAVRGYLFGLVEVPRFTAGFREPGITQAFLIWAFVALRHVNLNRVWIKVVLILGIMSTLSAAAIPIFLTVLGYRFLFLSPHIRIKMLKLIGWSFIFIPLLIASYYAPNFGLETRIESDSFKTRLERSTAGLSNALKDPLGRGVYNGQIDELGLLQKKNSNINLIASIGSFGFAGSQLLFLVFLSVFLLSRNRPEKGELLLPILLTWLIAQPFNEAALIFVLFFQEAKRRRGPERTRQSFE